MHYLAFICAVPQFPQMENNCFHLFHQHVLLLHFLIPTVQEDLLALQEDVADHNHECSHHLHRDKHRVQHSRPGNHHMHNVGQLVHQLTHCHAHGHYQVYVYQGKKFLEPANVHLTGVYHCTFSKFFAFLVVVKIFHHLLWHYYHCEN